MEEQSSKQSNDSPRPAFLEALLAPRGDMKHEDGLAIVTLNKENVAAILSLKRSDFLRELAQQNHEPALGTSDAKTAKEKDAIRMLNADLKASAGSLQRFIERISKDSAASSLGVTLGSDELPDGWRSSFAQARQMAMAHIKQEEPEVFAALKKKDGLRSILNQIDTQPESILDSLYLIKALDAVAISLQKAFPAKDTLASSRMQMTTIPKSLIEQLSLEPMDWLQSIVCKEFAPTLATSDGMEKLQGLMEEIKGAKTDKRVTRASIPTSEELQPFYTQLRAAIIGTIKTSYPTVNLLTDDAGDIPKEVVGRLALATHQIPYGTEYNLAIHHVTKGTALTTDETVFVPKMQTHEHAKLRNMLGICCKLDYTFAHWSEVLDTLQDRMRRQQTAADIGR